LSEKTGTQLLSPATLHDRSCFWMWTVEIQGGELMLMRRSSPDGITWSASPQAANIIGLKKGRQPWHIDVVREKDRLSAVLVSCTGLGGGGSRLHYAHSEDHGLTWFDSGFLFEQVYEFEAKIQYRATLRKVDDQTQEYELWYSAASLTNVFSIAYLRLIRRENKLLPCELRSLQSETLTPLK
jgi:hypothetical protein